MKDIVVIQQLQKRGTGLNQVNEVLQYEAIERKPRILDKAPKRLALTKASEINTYGCCSEYIMCYAELKSSTSMLQATIDLRGNKRFCDVELNIALRALIKQGITNIADRAAACFDVFKCIVMAPGDTLTVDRVYNALNVYQPMNYYAGELVKALNVCLYHEKAPVLYWVSLCELTGFYSKAIELGKDIIRKQCETEKDVDRLLRPLYKEAKDDAEFMKSVYKPAANKWLLPMLYLLKDTNPEALEPNATGGGFA